MHDLNEVQTRFTLFANNECKGYSNHYYELALAVADDQFLLDFVAKQIVTQPNLFFAAVQLLSGLSQMPQTAVDLHSFVRENETQLAGLMQTRRTQTNETGRCAALLPALPPGRLALVEVGTSAGLCLLMDQFQYHYQDQIVGTESPVSLHCDVSGDFPTTLQMPVIGWRAGLDLQPVDVHNGADAQWLLACVWPEHEVRRRRLAAAIELAKTQQLVLRQGNLADASISQLLSEVPDDLTLVVFHCAALAYCDKEQRESFAHTLIEASNKRDIVWISYESPTVIPEVTALDTQRNPRSFLLGRTWLKKGGGLEDRVDELLAHGHPHGAELSWCS